MYWAAGHGVGTPLHGCGSPTPVAAAAAACTQTSTSPCPSVVRLLQGAVAPWAAASSGSCCSRGPQLWLRCGGSSRLKHSAATAQVGWVGRVASWQLAAHRLGTSPHDGIKAAAGCRHAHNNISFTWRLPSLPPASAVAPLENLLPVVVEVGSEEACSQFVEDLLGMHGRIDHAVSCFGSQWQRGEWRAGGRAPGCMPLGARLLRETRWRL